MQYPLFRMLNARVKLIMSRSGDSDRWQTKTSLVFSILSKGKLVYFSSYID